MEIKFLNELKCSKCGVKDSDFLTKECVHNKKIKNPILDDPGQGWCDLGSDLKESP
jgi:hypothetical protein